MNIQKAINFLNLRRLGLYILSLVNLLEGCPREGYLSWQEPYLFTTIRSQNQD